MKPTVRLNVGRVFLSSLVMLAGNLGTAAAAEKDREAMARGRELFTREWLPGDRRSHAGDGLGPLFNARSCAACHHLGGIGGAGPKHTNVTVVSAFLEPRDGGIIASIFGIRPKRPQQPDRSKLAEIHPALRTENSFPLHCFATEKEFANWRGKLVSDGLSFGSDLPDTDELQFQFLVVGGFGGFSVTRNVGNSTVRLIPSQRNAPSLFGAGVIDRIPNRVLEEAAAFQARAAKKASSASGRSAASDNSPRPVSGRIARLRDGRLGHFGWKGQTATAGEFTLQACAIELGLDVPGFPQAALPWKAGYKAPGLDLTADQCDALVNFVSSLPPPSRKPPETGQHAAEIAAGQKLFERTGCAVCHQPKLGDVEAIYSDLLLHDMGETLSDTGVYSGPSVAGDGPSDRFDPLPVLDASEEDARRSKPKFGASPREWRTPPLWGLRDSAPYLHDGRADTIGSAVAFHGGEGLDSAQHFFALTLRERQQIELFLQSLTLPGR